MNALRTTLRRVSLAVALVAGSAGVAGSLGCESEAGPQAEAVPDDRLETHVIEASTPTDAGLSYLRAVADVHARADAASDDAAVIEILREGLALPPPDGLGEAEILRLELAARLGETLLPARAREARELLSEMLPPDRSLPLDRASAHALVVLGDAAVGDGDDALAVGSYARAIRMMSLLRQELKQ